MRSIDQPSFPPRGWSGAAAGAHRVPPSPRKPPSNAALPRSSSPGKSTPCTYISAPESRNARPSASRSPSFEEQTTISRLRDLGDNANAPSRTLHRLIFEPFSVAHSLHRASKWRRLRVLEIPPGHWRCSSKPSSPSPIRTVYSFSAVPPHPQSFYSLRAEPLLLLLSFS